MCITWLVTVFTTFKTFETYWRNKLIFIFKIYSKEEHKRKYSSKKKTSRYIETEEKNVFGKKKIASNLQQ